MRLLSRGRCFFTRVSDVFVAGKVMVKKTRLKSRRKTEARKIDLAVNYEERGVATGGGRIGIKKVRRTLEARYIPTVQRVPTPSKKKKQGRHHPPPAEIFRSKRK
jgi:hypothetical protein